MRDVDCATVAIADHMADTGYAAAAARQFVAIREACNATLTPPALILSPLPVDIRWSIPEPLASGRVFPKPPATQTCG